MDSWEEIIAAIDDGSAKDRYAVGATKELDLGQYYGTVHMQLAGFDLDALADGSGRAATTWIAVELLPKGHNINDVTTSEGGWEASGMRRWLRDEVMPAVPEAVRDRIVTVQKKQGKKTTEDTLWVPDYE